jgi:hypothetical protein
MTFADRINPKNLGFSPFMAAIIGAIIGHDYGVRDRKGGHLSNLSITSDGFVVAQSTASNGGGAFLCSKSDLFRNLDTFKAALGTADRAQFETLQHSRITDWL